MPQHATAAGLVELVRTHFIRPIKVGNDGSVRDDDLLPGAVVLTEVPSPDTGARRIDALAIGLTRARGGLDGFEVKVSRSDWLHELDQPRKADAWFDHTHRWWVLAPSTEIVRPEELPEGWGLMVPNPRSSQRLKTVVRADTRTPRLDWPVLCEITKKVDRIRADEVKAATDAVRTQLQDEARRQREQDTECLQGPNRDAAELGFALAEATGMQPWELRFALEHGTDWTREALTAVFAAARATQRRHNHAGLRDQARREANRHVDTADKLRAALDVLGDLDTTAHRAA